MFRGKTFRHLLFIFQEGDQMDSGERTLSRADSSSGLHSRCQLLDNPYNSFHFFLFILCSGSQSNRFRLPGKRSRYKIMTEESTGCFFSMAALPLKSLRVLRTSACRCCPISTPEAWQRPYFTTQIQTLPTTFLSNSWRRRK